MPSLLLTTTGRKSGQKFLFPLFYGKSGNSYYIVASKGGAPEHPGWYKNILANPEVEIQVATDKIKARARTASGEERAKLWKAAAEFWPPYIDYQKKVPEPRDPGRGARSDQLTLMVFRTAHDDARSPEDWLESDCWHLGLSDTRYGVIVRTTCHMDPLLERQKSRKRNWPIITDVLDWMST